MRTKEEITNSLAENEEKRKNLNVDDYINEAKNKNQPQKDEYAATISADYDKTIENLTNQNKKAVSDTITSYENEYGRNAVQKIINEKLIAEKNSDLGITDSGLNKTQLTAAQLSYANQKGKLDVSKDNALKDLALNLESSIVSVNQQKNNAIMQNNTYWDGISREDGIREYTYVKNDLDNDIAIDKQELSQVEAIEENEKLYNSVYETSDFSTTNTTTTVNTTVNKGNIKRTTSIIDTKNGLLSRDYYGTLKDNNIETKYNYVGGKIVNVTYTDKKFGKEVTIDYGVNPYTGDNNKSGDSDAAKAANKYQTYSNGYQPKGVIIDGVDYGKIVKAVDKTTPEETDGIAFNVHMTLSNGTRYWVWKAKENNYVEVIPTLNEKNESEWKEKE